MRLEIPIPSGLALAGVLHRPAGPSASGVVICHGMLSYKDSPKHVGLAEALCARGHAVLRFDFQGRGESPGDLLGLTFSRQVVECQAAIATLRARTGASRIGLAGSSMGGAVAILVAAGGGIAGLATMAAVGRSDLLAQRLVSARALQAWQRRGQLRLEQDPIGYSLVEDGLRVDLPAAAAEVGCPWLILHGDHDEVVPPSDAVELAAASRGRARLEWIAGADHRFSDPGHRQRVTARVAQHLDESLRAERTP